MKHTANDIGISVIVPCFNSKDTIEETLGRIVNQNVDNMEIIVVDDGSTDKTEETLSKYKKKIKYVYQTNQGVSAARNHGVALAEKEWIAFCDADDIWCHNKLRICIEVINKFKKADFIFHDYSVIYGENIVAQRGTHSLHTFFPLMKQFKIAIPKILKHHEKIYLNENKTGVDYVDTYYGNGFKWMILGNFILPSSVMIKRNLFIDEGGFDPGFKVAEDTELFLRIAKKTDFLYIDYPLHGYRRSSGSLMAKNVKETLVYGINGIHKNCLNDEAVKIKYRKWINLSLSRRMADLGYYHLTELEKREALKNAISALKHDPFRLKAWKVIGLAMLPAWALQKAKDIMRNQKKRNWTDKCLDRLNKEEENG